MPNIEFTDTAVIVIAICITIICLYMLYKMKNGLRVKFDKTGISELDLSDKDVSETPENKEINNETNIV
jgi:hypothetical protein